MSNARIEQYLSYSSFNKRIPEVVSASNIQNLRLKVGILTKIDFVALADVIAIIDQFFVQEVEFVFVGDDSYTGLRGEDLFGFDL